jgi:hypothetical protein
MGLEPVGHKASFVVGSLILILEIAMPSQNLAPVSRETDAKVIGGFFKLIQLAEKTLKIKNLIKI